VFHTDLPSGTGTSSVPPCEKEGVEKIKQSAVKIVILITAFLLKIQVFKTFKRFLELKLYL
jgi:hypothetical protein